MMDRFSENLRFGVLSIILVGLVIGASCSGAGGDSTSQTRKTSKHLIASCFDQNAGGELCSPQLAEGVRQVRPDLWAGEVLHGRAFLEFVVSGESGERSKLSIRVGAHNERRFPNDTEFNSVIIQRYRERYELQASGYPDVDGYIKFSDGTRYPAYAVGDLPEEMHFRIRYFDSANKIYCYSYGSTNVTCLLRRGELQFAISTSRIDRDELAWRLSAFRKFAEEGFVNADI